MIAAQPRLTYSELRLMPDDGTRYELIEGEVFVAPAPNVRHQIIGGRLFFSFYGTVERNHLGAVYFAPLDVVFGERTVLQPDIIFVAAARLGIVGPEYILGAPDLVVEILSPHRPAYDRVTKFDQYARYGAKEYWVVDPMAETVEMFRLAESGYVLAGKFSGDDKLETPLLPGWGMSMRELFAD